jgi:2-keto-3-deoxy-L-rhamnonate aldolase RhmA
MMGPADLSLQLGVPFEFSHPRMEAAMQRVAAAAERHGKHWGRTAGSVEDVARYLELGARFLCYGADIIMVKLGLEAIRRDFAPLGFTFDDKAAGA